MTLNPESPTPSKGQSDTQDAARHEAEHVKDSAQSAAQDVAGTAKHQAGQVKDEAMAQARSLADSAKDEVASQASTQQQRLAEQSRTIADDLERLSRGEQPESEMVSRALSGVTNRVQRFTHQLETKEPADLLDDVRRFAARRPGTFLLVAAGIGLAAGRLTRGITDARSDSGSGAQDRSAPPASPSPTPRGVIQPPRPDAGPAGGPAPAPPAAPPTIDRVPGSVYYDDGPVPGIDPGGRP